MLFGEEGGITVIGEVCQGKILPLSLELLGAAKKLAQEMNCPVSFVFAGWKMDAEVMKMKHYGIDEIFYLEDKRLQEKQKEFHREAMIGYLKEKNPKVVFVGGSAFGRILAGELAFFMDTEVVTDAAALSYQKEEDKILITRPAFDGKQLADFCMASDAMQIITVRSGVMKKAVWMEKESGKMKKVLPDWITDSEKIKYKSILKEERKEVHLDRANRIVAGGRGMKGKEGFSTLEQLAQRLGAEVGSTRPCVDAGWTLQSQQIGQSGIAVKPKLYIACGISGAIQHITGITSECMIAINQNPRAAIFQYCDYGVVGDAKKILEFVIEKIDQGKEFL